MVSTFHGLELGKRGLLTSQANISTTGHNIANANTKGYSRQQVNTEPASALNVYTNGQVNPSQLGSGVLVNSITRARDQYLDNQYRNQSASLGEWSVKQETLEQLEAAVNEPSETGLSTAMDQLWAAWDDLALNPDSLPARAVVKERAKSLVETAQAIDQSMSSIKEDLNAKQTAKLTEANQLLDQIADLNTSIRRTGKQANDLLDKRDVLVEELSKLTSVQVSEQNDGTYTISLADGTSLVNGSNVENRLDATSNITSGELAGITQSMEIIDGYQGKLNDTVKALVFGEMTVEIPAGSQLADGTVVPAGQSIQMTVKGLNGLSELGWALSGDANGNAQPGAALFVADPDNFSVASLSINSDVDRNPGLIAASLRTETVNGQQRVVAGNSELAQLIANMRNEKVTIDGNSQSVGGFFQAMISELGTESKAAMNHVANQEAAQLATDNRRQSVMGVSLDEEMANLIKYQHAYNAAARVVSTTDQLLDTLINMAR